MILYKVNAYKSINDEKFVKLVPLKHVTKF